MGFDHPQVGHEGWMEMSQGVIDIHTCIAKKPICRSHIDKLTERYIRDEAVAMTELFTNMPH